MKRRDIIRNVATGSLFVAGVGSAEASNRESGSTVYKLERVGDTFELVETFDGDVGTQHHFPDDCPDGCCWNDCCKCTPENCDSGICYCHETCDDPGTA